MQAQTLKALFYSEDWVFITVDAIALPISQCPVSVFTESKTDNGRNTFTEIPEHPLSKILKTPNPYQTGTEFFYSYAVDFILGGNGFIYAPSMISQIFNLPFERCQLDFDAAGMPTNVFFSQQYQDDVVADLANKLTLPYDQIIHSRRPNPSSAFWGHSPFVSGRKSVLTNRYTQDYILAFYLKGATPQMILEVENAASQKSLVRMIRSFEAAYTGRRNARRTMLLPKGVKATMADTKIVDQQFIELVKNNRETVLNILRVPKHALGLQESGSLGSREHEQALRWFWQHTIQPTIGFLESSLNRILGPRWNLQPNQKIRFDTSAISYTQEDLLTSANTSTALEKVWTLNERRDRLFGLPPLEGGDEMPGATQPQFPFLSAEPPPEVQTILAIDTPEIEAPAETSEETRVLSFYRSQVEQGEKGVDDAIETVEPDMKQIAVKLLVGQTQAAIDALAKSFGSRSMDDFQKTLGESIDELEEQYLDDYNKTMSSSFDVGYDTQLGMIFSKTNQDALAAYTAEDKKGKRLILKDRGIESFKSVKKTTTDRVSSLVEKGLAEGNTIGQVSDSIVKFMRKEAQWRANVIARTETLTAFSAGNQALVERAKEILPKKNLKKVWVNSGDDLVRDSHKNFAKPIVGIDEEFTLPSGVKAAYPRAPGLPADESIQCRCTMLMYDTRDMDASDFDGVNEIK